MNKHQSYFDTLKQSVGRKQINDNEFCEISVNDSKNSYGFDFYYNNQPNFGLSIYLDDNNNNSFTVYESLGTTQSDFFYFTNIPDFLYFLKNQKDTIDNITKISNKINNNKNKNTVNHYDFILSHYH